MTLIDLCTMFAVLLAGVIAMGALVIALTVLADMTCERMTGHGLLPRTDDET